MPPATATAVPVVGPTAADGPRTLSSASELMEHWLPSSPIDPGKRLAAAQDLAGGVLAFSVGTDGRLYAISADPGGPTGWRQSDISPASVAAGAGCVEVAAAQDLDGTLHLATASVDSSGAAVVHVLSGVRPDPAPQTWSTTPAWVDVPYAAGGTFAPDALVLGTSADGLGDPTVVASGTVTGTGVNTGPQHFVVPADGTGGWQVVTVPENDSMLVDVRPATVGGSRGLVTLYDVAGSPQMVFTTFPDPVYGLTAQVGIDCPPDARCLASFPGGDGGADVYVGGSGIALVDADTLNQAIVDGSTVTPIVVAGADVVPEATRLIVAGDPSGATAVWSVDSQGNLTSTTRGAGTDDWSPALLIGAAVTQVAPLRNLLTCTSEMVSVDASAAVTHLWQDATTTLWTQAALQVHDTSEATAVQSYATTLLLTNADGSPAVGVALTLSASQRCSLVVNGVAMTLTPTSTVPVATDGSGCITLVNPVQGIVSPVVHISGDQFAAEVDVDPSAGIIAGLTGLNATGLSHATDQTGATVVPDTAQASVPAVVDVLNQLTPLIPTLPADGSAQPGTPTFLTLRAAGTAQPGLRAAVPEHAWLLRFEGGRPVEATTGIAASVDPLGPTAGLGGWLTAAAGDVLSFLKHSAHDIASVSLQVVNGVHHLVVTLADRVIHAVLDAVEHVVGAIEWLFHTLEVDIATFIRWLGYLFDWDDITATHRVLVNLAGQVLDYAQTEFTLAEDAVTGFFTRLEDAVRGIGAAPPQVASSNVADTSRQNSAPSGTPAAPAIAHPAAHFSSHHTQHSGVLSAQSDDPSVSDDVLKLLRDFVTDVIEPVADAVTDTVKALVDDLKAAFDAGTLTPALLIETLASDVMIGVLQTAQAIAVGALKLIADVVKIIQDALTTPLDIPFLSGLYQKVVGSPMTILDGLALLVAIPATVVCKIATNEAPFAGSPVDFTTVTWGEVMGTGLPPGPTASGAVTRSAADAPATKVPESAAIYSHVGGYVNAAAVGLVSVVNMAKVMAELASSAKWPDRVNVGVSTLALSVTYPVGDDTDKDGLALERILWVFVGLGVARDAIALALPEDTEEAIGAAQLAMTVCNEALIVWIMIVELQGSYDNATSFFKFVQNTVQALSDGLAARARTIPTDDPDPDTRAALIAAKAAYTGYSSAVGLISALLNLVRTLMSDSNDIHYVF